MNFRETRDSLESVGPEERVSLQLPLDQGLQLFRDLLVPCPTLWVGSPLGQTGLGVTRGSHPVPGLDRLLLPTSDRTLRDVEGLCYTDLGLAFFTMDELDD